MSNLWAAHLNNDEGMMKKPELILALSIIGMKKHDFFGMMKQHDFSNDPGGNFG